MSAKQKQLVADLQSVVKAMIDEQNVASRAYHADGYTLESESEYRNQISRILNQSIGKLDSIVARNGGESQTA